VNLAGRFDLAVVGAGPGGYVAAIRAAQLGRRVAVVESDEAGGVCLNWGCIPSKALLSGAELVESLRAHGELFGIRTGQVCLDFGRAVDYSRRCAERLRRGVEGLLRKRRIELVRGRARLATGTALEVEGAGDGLIEADHLVLATGSAEWHPPGVPVDGRRVVTSRESLAWRATPRRLAVLGGGAVGVELGYVHAMYGARVTLIEQAEQLLPGVDAEVARVLARELGRKGIDVRLRTRFRELKVLGDEVRVRVEGDAGDESLDADQVLVALGRRARTQDLGLEDVGIGLDARGFVEVGPNRRTRVPTVSAVGDVAGGPLLAHKASEEGLRVAELLAGAVRPPLDPRRIPACVYAQPQVAWIGYSEAEARVRWGDDVRVGRFPFSASGRAVAAAQPAGLVKIIAEPEYGEIVGAHVVGAGATELIAEIGLAVQLESTTAELVYASHAHPTLSEALLEATLAAEGRAIHI
jgi:dihydrolipoamide dehydrogenase